VEQNGWGESLEVSGEFERRIREQFNPNELQKYPDINSVWAMKTVEMVVAEAKAEFFPTKPIWSKKYLENQLRTDGTLTQAENQSIKQTILLMKWFGCQEGTGQGEKP